MNKKALVEAALFVSDTPLTIERIANIVGVGDEDEVAALVNDIRDGLKREDRGIELVETPEGYEFRVKKGYREDVAKLAPLADLSDGMLRTLAIVAVRQPIKQSLIVKYQGNKAYDYIKGLVNKGLIRTEPFGRTKIVTTTPGFEKYFGTSTEEMKKMMDSSLAQRRKEMEEEGGSEGEEPVDFEGAQETEEADEEDETGGTEPPEQKTSKRQTPSKLQPLKPKGLEPPKTETRSDIEVDP